MNFSAQATAMPVNTAVAIAKIRAGVQLAVEQACQLISEEAKAIVPVRTGELRDSIGWSAETEGNKVIGTVSATAAHAIFVEMGTGRRGAESPDRGPGPYSMSWPGMSPRPYLRPAVDVAREEVKGLFIDAVRAALRK